MNMDHDETIQKGKLIEFTYKIKDQSGNVVEQVDLPLSYIHGHDSGMYPKIEKTLEGHKVGDTVSISLTPEEGFGYPDPAMTFEDDIKNIPPEYREVGAEAEFHNERGEKKSFRVTKIENDRLTMDGNHPLAGQTITFYIDILGIRDATDDELSGAVPTGQDAALPTEPPTLN